MNKLPKISIGWGQKDKSSYQDSDLITPPEDSSKKNWKDKVMFWKNEGSIFEKISDKVNNTVENTENFRNGMLIMVGGMVLIMFSFCFIPLIPIAPGKFCGMFSLGSIVIMFALQHMMGFQKFMKTIVNKSNVGYAFAYVVSLCLGLYYSVISSSYFLSLVFTGVQVPYSV